MNIFTTIEIKILDPKIKNNKDLLPKYATPGSSALDLRASIKEKINLPPKEVVLIRSGISIYINDPYVTALILPRSGLGHKNGIVLGNLTGLIDSDYQGELMISLWNRSKKDFFIYPYNKIAQIMFLPILKPKFSIVENFEKDTVRYLNGFGHSGI